MPEYNAEAAAAALREEFDTFRHQYASASSEWVQLPLAEPDHKAIGVYREFLEQQPPVAGQHDYVWPNEQQIQERLGQLNEERAQFAVMSPAEREQFMEKVESEFYPLSSFDEYERLVKEDCREAQQRAGFTR